MCLGFVQKIAIFNECRKLEAVDSRFLCGTIECFYSSDDSFIDDRRYTARETEHIRVINHSVTRRRYACSKVALDDFFKEARMPHVTVSRIEQYKRERLAAKVKSATVNRDLALLRQLMKRAERERYIARNPFEAGNLFLEERKRTPATAHPDVRGGDEVAGGFKSDAQGAGNSAR